MQLVGVLDMCNAISFFCWPKGDKNIAKIAYVFSYISSYWVGQIGLSFRNCNILNVHFSKITFSYVRACIQKCIHYLSITQFLYFRLDLRGQVLLKLIMYYQKDLKTIFFQNIYGTDFQFVYRQHFMESLRLITCFSYILMISLDCKNKMADCLINWPFCSDNFIRSYEIIRSWKSR